MSRPLFHFALCAGALWVVALLLPTGSRPRSYARRASCQSNLKQIGLGVLQYVQDYDERFPPARVTSSTGWADVVQPYINSKQVFQCPSAPQSPTNFSSDYFYNRSLARISQDKIKVPRSIVMAGDGSDNALTWVSLTRLPPDSISNPDSPARRHMDSGNYLFADGHVKWIKVDVVNRYFRTVNK